MAHHYTITTTKPLQTLRGLRMAMLAGCDAAVRMGDCEPSQVIAEVRGVLGTLLDDWLGKRRDEVLQRRPFLQRVT